VKVHDFLVEQNDTTTTVSAEFVLYGTNFSRRRDVYRSRVLCLLGLPTIRMRVWFEIPNRHYSGEYLDAFFVTAFPMASHMNEDMWFDGTVSKRLLQRVDQIKAGLQLLDNRCQIHVQGTHEHPRKKAGAVAQFFTLGIDSFFTLLTNKIKPKYLLYIYGFDIPLKRSQFYHEVKARFAEINRRSKTQSVFLTTNLREFSDRVLGWDRFFGAGLVASTILCSRNIDHVLLNGSYMPGNHAHGSAQKLDRLWSTEYLKVEGVGYRPTRMRKIQMMKKHPLFDLVLKHVRVCWRNVDDEVVQYNCTKCEKCQRTYFAFLANDVIPKTFTKLDTSHVTPFKVAAVSLPQWEHMYALFLKKKNVSEQDLSYVKQILDYQKVSI
jgi:hypothetical protein